MKYIRTTLATDWKEDGDRKLGERLVNTLFSFIPESNPEYEGKLHLIEEWLIEFDDENIPDREIALDGNGAPIFAGPTSENYGFWLDTNMKYPDFPGQEISSAEFEKFWVKTGVEETC